MPPRSLPAIVLALALSAGNAAAIELPPGPGRDLVYGKCRTCHDLQYLVDSAGVDESTWNGLLDDMEGFGCEFTAGQRAHLLAYLATYLGPDPPPAGIATPVATAADAATLFREQCASCHQENGRGVPGDFPPLDGNPDLFADRLFPAYVLLFGLEGEIVVKGETYNGTMPDFSHLTDAEIVSLIRYIRHSWSNVANPLSDLEVTPDDVAGLRRQRLGPAAVHAYRLLRVVGRNR